MCVKTHYTKVDALIANVKAVTVKNKTRTELFKAEGLKLSPQPVVTVPFYFQYENSNNQNENSKFPNEKNLHYKSIAFFSF